MDYSCNDNNTNMENLYKLVTDEMFIPWYTFINYFEYQPWIFSMLGSAIVGLSGVFPLLIIPIDEGADLKNGAGAATLKLLLSFAVGGLLGDVFLHLLPEAWSNKSLNTTTTKGHPSIVCGLWVLAGFLVFIIAEKIFIGETINHEDTSDDADDEDTSEIDENIENKTNNNENNNNKTANGIKKINKIDYNIIDSILLNKNNNFDNIKLTNVKSNNGITLNGYYNGLSVVKNDKKIIKKPKKKHIIGYLNLLANCIDNFTHGLAVGGSFLVSFRLGTLTTFAILIHEIPHEVGDFAILLKSGFNRWDAAKAQLMTATGGIFGALVAVLCSGNGVESRTSWILPFTAGSFLHIGLVTVLPELLKESDPKESIKQLASLLSGIIIMALLTILCD
ncbi:hypothetical protein HCN44_000684 [Aphidius gifuensis]|uniref:Uncharacterized protein n=1 Tax=Aphidius gifuensis TaxID=684658 RepID=A0A834XTB9_APHGI|nr:zinc transporter ZIP13 homolog [Aphidius gifuensis]KAF7990879.1 hypothetical protein HCN44_000684 [Aphidius gifuensis]